MFFIFVVKSESQIANYVSDGSFESLNSNSVTILYNVATYWQPIDTNKDSYYVVSLNSSINPAPNCSYGFQYPRSGNNFALGQFFCEGSLCTPTYQRDYLRNRLKQDLQAGKTYCAKYFVVNTNNNRIAMEKYGMYFGSSILDTITYCNAALTYITPQIENNSGVITDTLNWTAITGTFIANGSEKYMVIGNFKSNPTTNTLQLNTPLSTQTADIYIDDVSVIELTLPAYAGPDIYGIPTTTVYLGRQRDVGIDEACLWYHLPNTTTAIDTAAGITVTVATTTNTYMVKQDICGMIKYDTVVVYASAVGMNELEVLKNNIKLFPNPANDVLNITLELSIETEFNKLEILNNLGQIIREEEINFKNKNTYVKTNDLPNGMYILNLYSKDNFSINKKIVVSR